MKKLQAFFSCYLLFCLFWSSHSTWPIDFVFKPASCSSNLDCVNYRFSRCNGLNQCARCSTAADCSHISSDTICVTSLAGTKYCSIPCSTTENELCINMRASCRIDECRQCANDGQCRKENYPGIADPWCDSDTIPGYQICSSCPKDGCPGTSVCQNFKCVECTGDHDCGGTTPYCDIKFIGNFCKACLGDSHCSGGKHCSSESQCVQCTQNSHCDSGNCSTENTCVECNDDTGCLDSSKPYCVEHACHASVYQSQCAPDYNIQVNQINDRREQFNINFPSALASKVDLKGSLTLTLMNVPESQYNYTLHKQTKTHYQAVFTIQNTIPATKLRLQMTCPSQPPYFYGDIILDISTKNIPFTTPEIQETIETIQSLTNAASTVMAGASGSMMLAGANPAIMWALIGLLQAFYYMIFINVQYPVNVQAFFSLFTLGNLSFIPNPIEWFFPEIDDVDLQAPEKFLENDVDGLFLQTAGNMLLTWFLVLMGYLTSKLFLKFTRNMPKLLNTGASKTIEIFEWSGVIRTLLTSYTQLSLAAFLQIRVLNFDRKLYGVSSLCGIAFTVFAFLFPLLTIFLIRKLSKSPKLLKAKYSTITEEFKYDQKKLTPIYFNAFFLLRRLVLTLTLVFLHNHPYLELLILILNCVIWLVLLCWFLPYENKINNLVNIISELLFVVIHVIIFLFAHDDYGDWMTDTKKLDLGWIIIGCCGVILGLTLIVSFIEQYYAAKNLIKLLLKVLKGKKLSQKTKGKRSPQIRREHSTIQNMILNSSRDQLENSLASFAPLQNIAHRRPKILRPQIRNRNGYNQRSPIPNRDVINFRRENV